MSTDANRQAALKMIAALSEGRLDESLLTDDVTWWVPGMGSVSKAQFRGMADGFKTMVKGGCPLTVHGVTADGDRVAVEVESHADLVNGKHYNNHYHFLFLFRDGKIYQCKEYNDSKHVADVLGDMM